MRKYLLCALLLVSCNTTDSGSGGGEAALVGKWEASFNRVIPSQGINTAVTLKIELGQDRKSSYEMDWNGKYASGFAGGWSLSADTLFLTATRCFKADSSGAQAINNCDEDLPSRILKLNWDGSVISAGQDTARVVFRKKAV